MVGKLKFSRGVAVVAIVVAALVALSPSSADAVGGEGEGWPSFNESDGCGSPWMRGPRVERTGSLPSYTVLRGPHADYFGRTISQVWDSLRWWDVPMSNGESLRLHKRLIPALSEVEAGLAYASSQGNYYGIVDRYTYGYTPRTVGRKTRISQHGLGNAIDINSTTNPYTTGKLKTNMPSWFVNTWKAAGFCWGGNWIDVKDAMHYNWRGPNFTSSISELPPSYAPLTSSENFTRQMYKKTVPGRLESTNFRLLMDADGDGAIDVVNVSPSGSGTVVDVVRSTTGFKGCAVSRYLTPHALKGTVAIPGDWDRDGSQDLWFIDDTNGVKISALLRFGDFSDVETLSVGTAAGDVYLAADHNVDGWSDLYVLRHDGFGWSVEVRSGADRFGSILATGSFAGDESLRFTALDRDRDQVPDLMGVASSGSIIVDGASGFNDIESVSVSADGFDDISGTDFDGDGRHDLVVLDDGKLVVYAGNSRLSGVQVTGWFEYPNYDCSDSSLAYPYEGKFRDDDTSVHRGDIDAIEETDITKGCNPPLNDRFCPDRKITRGELAAFIRRALALPDGSADSYVDDDSSEFEGDIESLVAAGMVFSCNAAGDRFCPDKYVTRGVMARFLVVAFGFEPSSTDAFVDDSSSLFEGNINAIAAVGVTKGCNPPANDRFCPDRTVPREEMASFMVRALGAIVP
jgi:hypothetical protein